MRAPISPVVLVLSLLSPTAAQGPVLQEFGLWPDVSHWSSRASLPGPSNGTIVQTFEGARLHGTGQVGSGANVVGRLRAIRAVVQDQEAVTRESVSLALLADDPANPGRPLATSAGILAQAGPVQTPPFLSGTHAWIFTLSFAAPMDVVPQTATFHVAVDLPAAPLWTADGLSVHAYTHSVGPPPGFGTPILVGAIDRTNGNAWSRPSQGETLRVQLMVEGPVFMLGADLGATTNVNPLYGILGVYPDRFRSDGLAWRVVDGNRPSARVFLLASAGGFGSSTAVPGLDGLVWLDVPRLFPVVLDAGALIGAGGSWYTIVPWAAYPANLPQAPITYQVLVVPQSGPPILTNAISTN